MTRLLRCLYLSVFLFDYTEGFYEEINICESTIGGYQKVSLVSFKDDDWNGRIGCQCNITTPRRTNLFMILSLHSHTFIDRCTPGIIVTDFPPTNESLFMMHCPSPMNYTTSVLLKRNLPLSVNLYNPGKNTLTMNITLSVTQPLELKIICGLIKKISMVPYLGVMPAMLKTEEEVIRNDTVIQPPPKGVKKGVVTAIVLAIIIIIIIIMLIILIKVKLKKEKARKYESDSFRKSSSTIEGEDNKAFKVTPDLIKRKVHNEKNNSLSHSMQYLPKKIYEKENNLQPIMNPIYSSEEISKTSSHYSIYPAFRGPLHDMYDINRTLSPPPCNSTPYNSTPFNSTPQMYSHIPPYEGYRRHPCDTYSLQDMEESRSNLNSYVNKSNGISSSNVLPSGPDDNTSLQGTGSYISDSTFDKSTMDDLNSFSRLSFASRETTV